MRGVNLAIVTLAFAVAMDRAVFNNGSVFNSITGAVVDAPKLIVEPRPAQYEILGVLAGDGKQPNPMTTVFCLIVAVVLCYAVANLRRSATGRRMLATRSNERAAAAAGVNVAGTKVLAFAVSSFIAGVGGAVIAYKSGNATPDRFVFTQSLTFLAFAYLGGISSVSGAIAGGFLVPGGLVFTFLQSVVGIDPGEFTLILGGLGLIIAAIHNPEGISGGFRDTHDAGRRRRGASPSATDPPALTPAAGTGGGQLTWPCCQTSGMSVTFGGLNAVNDVDLVVEPGTLVGLIGPNGAGKTTFIDGVTGFVPTDGRIEFDGTGHRRAPAHQRVPARARPHVAVARAVRRPDASRRTCRSPPNARSVDGFFLDLVAPTRRRDRADVDFALDVLGIRDLADRLPNEISQGQRKLVVGGACAGGAAEAGVHGRTGGRTRHRRRAQELGSRLRRIIDAGTTIFLVDHDMGLVLNVCDYIYVIEFGQQDRRGHARRDQAGPDGDRGLPRRSRPTPRSPPRPPRRSWPSSTKRTIGEASAVTLLEIEAMSTGYNGVPVVRDLDLHRRRG